MLNIATQDIISSIIKAEDSIEELDAIRAIEDNEDELKERNIFTGKFWYLLMLLKLYNNLLQGPNTTYSLWKRIRLIIIAFKYSYNNKQTLLAQIKALNITQFQMPQLGK